MSNSARKNQVTKVMSAEFVLNDLMQRNPRNINITRAKCYNM